VNGQLIFCAALFRDLAIFCAEALMQELAHMVGVNFACFSLVFARALNPDK
jgi:hypothetical protein